MVADKAVMRSCVYIYLKNTKEEEKPSKLSSMNKVVGTSCVNVYLKKYKEIQKKKKKKGIWGDQDNLISNNLNAKPGNNE